MDFVLTEEQRDIQKMTRDFAQDHIAPGAAERDRDKIFPRELFTQLGELGLMGACIPERYGGAGTDFLAYILALEELSRADAVVRAQPDLPRLRELASFGVAGGLSVSAWDGTTAHTRVFAGAVCVPEDPATGSSALGYGAWLAASGLVPGDGESRYVVRQGAELSRPSVLAGTVVT